jgi:endonuclease/exonuclease/phosphatase family metal-dependent hydrolase
MTYNILNGGENRESYISDVIQTAQPDLVILQEVYTEAFLKSLATMLGMKYFTGEGNKKRKVALLSKLPVRSFKSHHPIFPIWRNFIDAEIEYEPAKTMRIIGVHPMANLGIAFEIWRLWEASHISKHARAYQNTLCLIAGDFNAIAPGETVNVETFPIWLKWIIYLQGNRVYHFSIAKLLSAGFTDCFRMLNSEKGFTLPPPSPNSRLDYIFVNAAMKSYLKRCWVVGEPDSVNLASDHYPVMAEFSFTG